MNPTPEQLRAAYDQAPQPLRAYLAGTKLYDFTEDIGKRYGLHVDVVGKLSDSVTHMLLGLKAPNDLQGELVRSGIQADAVNTLMQELNENIFKPLQQEIRNAPPESKQAPVPAPPPPVPAPIVPPPPQQKMSAGPLVPPPVITAPPPPPPPAPPAPPPAPQPIHVIRAIPYDPPTPKPAPAVVVTPPAPVPPPIYVPKTVPPPNNLPGVGPLPPPPPVMPPPKTPDISRPSSGTDPYREPIE